MKLQTKNFLGLRFLANSGSKLGAAARKRVQDMVYEHQQAENWTLMETARRQYVVDELLDDRPYKTYLVAETAQRLAARLTIDTDEDVSILQDLDQEHCCYLLAENEFVRFFRKGVNLYVYYFQSQERTIIQSGEPVRAEWTQIDYFTIGIPEGTGWLEKQRHRELAKRLVQLILFIKFADLEVLLLPPGKKVGGSRKSGNSVLNESPVPITRVDSSWNRLGIRADTIGVRDFLRFQRWGPGFSKRKLILIKAHERRGYTRTGGGVRNKFADNHETS